MPCRKFPRKLAPFVALALLPIAPSIRGQQPASTSIEPSSATAIVAGTTSMEVLDSTYRLGPGDRLSYRVVEERRNPTALMVADSGEVEVPLIGRVQARGRTCKELAQQIKPLLEREYFYKDHATVIIGLDAVSSKSRGRVYISGQVKQQGPIDIPPDERFTLSKAILKAGGFADFANHHKVKLLRKMNGQAQTTIIDLDEITVKGHLEKDPELQPDDTIIVPEKYVNF
ncbi:MAG TPA: polysaccharide biosynthesis/export family protein [Chthoniobacteraceae bacterium]|jgi:polysaccharide export outer membrane protein